MDSCANPHIVAYGNRPSILQPFVALGCIYGMSGGIKATVRGDEYIVAESDRCLIKDHEIEIGIEVFADRYIVAIITIKRLLDEDSPPRPSENSDIHFG